MLLTSWLHNPKLTLHSQELRSWFFYISHTFRNFYKTSFSSPTLPQSHYAGKSSNHSDARRHTATHTHTIVPVDDDHNDAHPSLEFIVYCVIFLHFFKFFFYGYGVYWLVVIASLSASVFVVDRRLFWGFDDNRNGVVVDKLLRISLTEMASLSSHLLWWSLSIWPLLSNPFSCLLFFILKLFLFSSLLWNFFSLLYSKTFCVLCLWKYN